MDTQTTVSPFLDETFRRFDFKPHARALLQEATQSGKIATSEIGDLFAANFVRDSKKFSEAMAWLTKIFRSTNVQIYIGKPEDLGWRRTTLSTQRVWRRFEQDDTEEEPPPSMYQPISQEELEKIRTVEQEFSKFYDSERVKPFYRQVSQYPLLSYEEVFELGKRIHDHDDLEARNKLVLHNLRLAIHIARKFIGRGLDYDDLVQEGCIGLLYAADKFDYRLGYHFSTYAYWWVKQKITRAIANKGRIVRIPVNADRFNRNVIRAVEQLTATLEREASVEEIAAEMGEEVRKVKRALEQMSLQPISLDSLISVGSDTGDDWHEITPDERMLRTDHTIVAREELEESELRMKQTIAVIHSLPITQAYKEVFFKRYGLNGYKRKTIDEIGAEYGLSRGWPWIVQKTVWKKLDEYSRTHELDVFNEETLLLEQERIMGFEDLVGHESSTSVDKVDVGDLISSIQRRQVVRQDPPTDDESTASVSGKGQCAIVVPPSQARKLKREEWFRIAKELLEIVSQVSGIGEDLLLAKTRQAQKVALTRQVYGFLLIEDFGVSTPVAGSVLNNRDHATMLHAKDKVKELLENGEQYVTDIVVKSRSLYKSWMLQAP